VILEGNETYKEKCEFIAHPCDLKVEIREIKPFYVCACKSILLDLKVISPYNINNFIKIKKEPKYGKVVLINSSTLIYKSTRRFSGFDLFQLLVEDEYGGNHIENILIRVVCK
jgi:hypothetical protein